MTACLLSVMTMQPANVLKLYPVNGGTPEQVAVNDIRHITFVDNVILVTTTGNVPAYYQVGNFNKIAFGEKGAVAIDKVQTPDPTVYITSEGEIVVSDEVKVLSHTVINIDGSVLQKNVSNRLSVSDLPTGIYLVKIETTQGVVVKKYLKN